MSEGAIDNRILSFDIDYSVIHFERLEVNPRFATVSRLSNAAVLARFTKIPNSAKVAAA